MMKQWKRLAALSSAIVMAAATLTYFPNDTLQNIRLEISASADETGAETTTEPQVWIEDNLTWKLDADGTLTISGTGAMKDYNAAENLSPAYMNSNIKKVVIEKGVTRIGELAFFKCSSLTNITIPDSVTCIAYAAFGGCTNLTDITIPDSVTSIGMEVFLGCNSLTSITIPNGITSIGDDMFSNCWSLTSITIPDSVTSIGMYAFSECSSLTSITIPKSVTSIGNSAFRSCNNLTVYLEGGSTLTSNDLGVDESKIVSYWNEDNLTWTLTADGTLTISGTGAMKGYNNNYNPSPACGNSSVKKVVIEDGVTSIGYNAFYGCSTLTGITIPDSVTSIGGTAFQYCSSLSSITIPNSVTSIGSYAFSGCGLTSITIPDSVTSIGSHAFYDCSSLTSITIPDSVTSIGSHAFYDCSSLTSITIPNSVTSIGEGAFHYCSSLTSITIPDSVTNIEDYAFYKCSSLTSITIPDSVTSIGDGAFKNCSGLTSITIPKSVTSIGDSAFDGCTNLTVYLENGSTLTSNDLGVDERKIASYWKEDNLTWTLDADGTLNISGTGTMKDYDYNNNPSPVYNNSKVKKVVIEKGVTTIGEYAFCNCTSLTDITIPDSVTNIEDFAFEGCISLTSITIPDGVTSIGTYAFGYCSDLISITIPDSVTSIGNFAFRYCISLTSITIPDSVTSIGYDAFYACSSLKTISLSCKSTLKRSDFGKQANLVSASHTLKKTEAKDATCTESGNKEYWTCEHCGKYFLSDDANPETAKAVEQSEFIIPALNHKNATTRGVAEPTGTAPGYSGDLYCPDCDTVLEKGYTYWKEGNLTWKLDADGTLTISGTGAMKDYNDDGNPSPASYWNSIVRKIVIEDGVTSIGDLAFYYCSSLTSITIPDSVTSIGNAAFESCSSLTSITIPDSVTIIGESAFFYCTSLTNITLSNNITNIGNEAFYSCSSLTSITIPDSVTSIGNDAFYGCSSLQIISLSCKSSLKKSNFGGQADLVSASHTLKKTEAKTATCSESGNKAYWTCEHCGKYFLSDDANPETAKAVELSETVIPASHKLTKVEAKAATCSEDGNKEYWTCEHCKKYFLSDDTNPETAKAVEQSEFIIPALKHKNATTRGAFEPTEIEPGYSGDLYCPDCDTVLEKGYTYWKEGNLTWKLDADGTLTISGTGAMKNYDYIDNQSPVYCNSKVKKVVIEDGVTSIENYAFNGCSSLTSITIPDGVTSIGNWVFNGCSSLTSITISDSVTSIGNWVFNGCSSLTSITISDSVTSIGYAAFYDCSSLTSITIPDSVTSIGNYAFDNCKNLKTISLSCGSALKKSDFGDKADLVSYTNQHILTKTEAKSATCTEDGNKEYWTCEHCKKYFLSDDTNPETAIAVEQAETIIPALVQIATTTTPIKCVYGQDMNKIDLRDYVKNTDVVGEVTVKVATGSTLPDGMKLDGSNLSGKPAKAYEDGKEVTFTFTAENGSTANMTLLFLVEKADPTVEVSVSGDSHTEGDLVSELKLILSENSTKGVVELVSEIKALVAGKNTFTWKFTPEDENNYHTVTGTVVVNAQTTTTTKPNKTTTTNATTTTKPSKTTTINVTTTTKPSKTTTTKATTTTKPSKTTTTNTTTTTKPSKTTTTKATTTTKPNKTTTTKVTTTTKPNKTTTIKVTTTTKPSKTTTTKATTTTKPNKTTTTKATTTTKPSKTTTTKATTTTKPNKTTTTKATTTTKPSKTTTTNVTTTTKPSKTTTTNVTTTTKPSKTTTTNATTTTKPNKTTTTKATTTTKSNKTTTTNATTTTKPNKTTTTNVTTTTKPSKTTTTKVTITTKPSKTTTTNATTTNTAIPSYGDVNLDGKVDIADAIFLNKYLATLIQFSDVQVANADCCQDGVLNDQDTTALMQFIILLIDDLPVQPNQE